MNPLSSEKNDNGDNAPVRALNDITPSSAKDTWDDKEIFLRTVFEEDPRKGCELLFKQYHSTLCSHAVRYVYSKEIAEDIVGDIFYTFWNQQLHLQVTSSYRAYLFITVRNRCLKYIAREFKKIDERAVIADLDFQDGLPSPQQILQFNELNLRIERAIHNLSPQCQRVFLLNRFEGKKYREIATELNVSVKTVEAHISKALDVLRKVVCDENI